MTEDRCPKCDSENIYPDRELWVCTGCAHEWVQDNFAEEDDSAPSTEAGMTIYDANGNALIDGDSVVVIKDLKIKGSSSSVKVGTKVRNIRLTEAVDGHNIACKIDGLGAINLKSEFVKKA